MYEAPPTHAFMLSCITDAVIVLVDLRLAVWQIPANLPNVISMPIFLAVGIAIRE